MQDMAGAHSYGYDDLHRLTSAMHPPGSALETKNEVFSYDAVGNRLADSRIGGYTYDAANRLLENSSYTYTYDADGNRTAKEDKLSGHTTTYAFNSENQLVGLTRPNGESWTYKYDRPGRRVEKSSGTSPSQTYRYIYDRDNIVAVLDGENSALQVITSDLVIDFVLGIQTVEGNLLYAHHNAIASVEVITSTAATVLESHEYAAYGGAASGPEYGAFAPRYIGRITDPESNLQELRYRYFDHEAGVFLSRDPIGETGGVNLYSYTLGSPINRRDSLGLWVDISGEGADKIQSAYEKLKSTRRGKKICGDVEDSSNYYSIIGKAGVSAHYNPWTRQIFVDPYKEALVPSGWSIIPSPLEVTLAHEIGHAATGEGDYGWWGMNNVNMNENPVRSELGLPLRTRYSEWWKFYHAW